MTTSGISGNEHPDRSLSTVHKPVDHHLQNSFYTQVREAIDAAFRDGEHTRTGEFAIEDVATGEPRYLRISCHPRREEGEEAGSQTVAVVIHDVTEAVRERYALEARLDETRKDFERLKRETEAEVLRHETHNKRLIAANRQLDEANRELTALNEDLSVVNEESLLSTEESQAATEESQAATEEVETLNEELQATNEELETLNEELQVTVEELNTTNDDLQARSAELQDLARARSQERQESERSLRLLEATLRSMSDAVLAVGPEGETLFCNEAFVETFGEVRDDESAAELLGNRALLAEDGERLAHEKAPRVRASRGESFQMPFVVDDEDGARRLFEVRGQSIEDGETNGGVIVICEIFGKAG
jgi:two-component system CheB/CheR fusion protein